jgi:hypothetical protein
MMQADNRNRDGHTEHAHAGAVQLPAPTVWPIVFAFGLALIFTGMVTHWIMSLLGALLVVPGVVGWFLEVLPQEHHVYVPVSAEIIPVASTHATRAQMPAGPNHRKLLPIETFSITAGIKGGLAGGTAMIVPAALYGLIRYHSIWYAVNLLAAGGFVSWAGKSDAFLAQFHLLGLLAAAGIHTTASLLIGLIYCAVSVDRPTLLSHRGHQPHPEPAHQLALVCNLPDCLWVGGGIRSQSASKGADRTVPGSSIRSSRRVAYQRQGRRD